MSRSVRIRLELPQDRVAVQLRHHHVQQHQIHAPRLQQVERFTPARGQLNADVPRAPAAARAFPRLAELSSTTRITPASAGAPAAATAATVPVGGLLGRRDDRW